MNKKGFTLVELLVMLVVLGILMAVTVPNISGILSQSKTSVLKEDVIKMVDTTKMKISSTKSISNPMKNKCLVFTLEYLNDTDDYTKGPNGGTYDFFDSFVIVKRVGNRYKYYVRLVEEKDGERYGISNADFDTFESNWNSEINTITDNFSLKTAKTPEDVSTNSLISTYCIGADSIQGFYKEM